MKLELHAKNGKKVTQAMKDYAEKKFSKIEKFYEQEVSAKVVLEVFSDHSKLEVTIPTNFFTLRTEERGQDFYELVDLVSDKLERQIKKNKQKINKSVRGKTGVARMFKEQTPLEELEKELVNKPFKEKEIKLEFLTPEEAYTSLEMVGHDFYVFLNEKTNRPAIVYKRKEEEKYGLIDIK